MRKQLTEAGVCIQVHLAIIMEFSSHYQFIYEGIVAYKGNN